MAAHLTPETMRFLRGLIKNNDRGWFEERRAVYERAVKAPMLALVDEIGLAMDEFAPDHVRPAHKIAQRIYRDTRFSPDKRPYKRHISAWWPRRGLEKTSSAGFYLQISPTESFVAAGLYAPEREGLLTLRRWLTEHHERYRATLAPLLKAKRRLPAMELIAPEALTRAPKGFPQDHPASDLLRARNWGVSLPLSAESVLSPAFGAEIAAHLRRATGLVNLLNEALLAKTERSSAHSTL